MFDSTLARSTRLIEGFDGRLHERAQRDHADRPGRSPSCKIHIFSLRLGALCGMHDVNAVWC